MRFNKVAKLAQLAAQLKHPLIRPVVDFGKAVIKDQADQGNPHAKKVVDIAQKAKIVSDAAKKLVTK